MDQERKKSEEGEPKGEVDADKTATQEVPSREETSLLEIGSIVEGDDLVSLGFNRRLDSWGKISLGQLFTGIPISLWLIYNSHKFVGWEDKINRRVMGLE